MLPTNPDPLRHAPWRAVVLAGGKGTRLRPLTESRPKPLVPFMGAPYAAGLLRRLAQAGCGRATFLVGPDAGPFAPIQDLGRAAGIRVDLVTEERPLDTAGAARRLLAGTGERSVVVLNGDILSDVRYERLIEAHRRSRSVATLALMRVEDPSSYGVVVRDDAGRVRRFLEKPAPGTTAHRTVNAGAYVLDASAFDLLPGDGSLSFERDVFPALVDEGALVTGVIPHAYWQDLGTPERYRAGHRAVLERRCAWPWAPGLRRIGPLAAVHRDAAVDRAASLAGPVVVGAGCAIEPGARIGDAVLFDEAAVEGSASVSQAILGRGARVRSGIRLDPGSVLADGAVVAGPVTAPSREAGPALLQDPPMSADDGVRMTDDG